MRAGRQRRPRFPLKAGHLRLAHLLFSTSSFRFLSLWERLGEGLSPKAPKGPARVWPSWIAGLGL